MEGDGIRFHGQSSAGQLPIATSVIADINAGKLEVSPHSFGDAALGNMYWDSSNGPLTDQKWLTNMSAIDTWKQGNGGADIDSFVFPFHNRPLLGFE